MKILLRDEETQLYYGREGNWVAELAEAMDFETIDRARQKVQECAVAFASIVLKYETPQCELALNPAFCVPRASPLRPFTNT